MPPSASPDDRARVLRRLRRLTTLLDSAVRIPGTKLSVGIDPLLGLIPAAGDAVSLAFSAYIIQQAAAIGAPRPVVARMVANVGIDFLVGSVPVLGDIFDVAYKANVRNLRLLETALNHPASPI